MATVIRNITAKQDSLLRKAFGYESYPNLISGHTRKAEEFLKENGVDIEVVRNGNAYTTRAIAVSDISHLESQLEEIAVERDAKKKADRERLERFHEKEKYRYVIIDRFRYFYKDLPEEFREGLEPYIFVDRYGVSHEGYIEPKKW